MNRFYAVEKEIAEAKVVQAEYEELVHQIAEEKGHNGHWSNAQTGIVYQVKDVLKEIEEKGKLFRTSTTNRFTVARTKSEELGDKKGSLSKVQAKELGYIV